MNLFYSNTILAALPELSFLIETSSDENQDYFTDVHKKPVSE